MEKPFHQDTFPFVLKSCHFWRRFKVRMSCGIAAKLSCNDTLAVEWLWNGRRPQMALPTVSKCVWKLDRIAATQSVSERANLTHRVKSRKHQAHIFQANDRHQFPKLWVWIRALSRRPQMLLCENATKRQQRSEIDLDLSRQQQQLSRSLMCVQGTASKDAMVDILDKRMVWLPQLVLTATLVLILDEPVWHWIDSNNNNLLICNSHREQRYTGSHVALFPTQDHHQQQHHACFTSDPKLFISKSDMKLRQDQRCNHSKLAKTFLSVRFLYMEENKLFLSCGLRLHVKVQDVEMLLSILFKYVLWLFIDIKR